MRCCVSFCKNSSDAISRSQNVTFHEFPTDQMWCGLWITALGMEESHITDTTVVCSLHFRKVDFYETKSEPRKLHSKAVPSAVQVCLICLNTDTKLYPMSKYHLEEAYTNVTGLKMPDDINFAQMLCAECAHRLMNGNRFRDKCLTAHKLLLELWTKHELLTTHNIKKVNREVYELSSNLVTKTFDPDHCDLHMIEKKEEDKSVKLETNTYNSVKNVEVKSEINDTVEIVIEPMDIDLKCDNESDQEFLNDDIDNDTEFLNKGLNVEVEISNNDIKDEWKDDCVDMNDSDLEIVKDMKVGSDINVNKSDKSVKKKSVVKPKVKKVINKVTKTRAKSDAKKKVVRKSKVAPKSFKVTTLTYEEQLEDVMKRKESTKYKDLKYKCSLCYTGFASQISYDRHAVKHTNEIGELECALCKLRFKIRHHLTEHIKRFHTMRYSCTSCSYVTKQKKSAVLHARWHEGTTYKCPQCAEEFSRYSTYMSHLRLKHPSDFVCVLCGYSFVSKLGIQQHCNFKHRYDDKQNIEGPLCEPCNMRFASEEAYNNHVKVSPKHAAEGSRLRNDPQAYSYYKYRKQRAPGVEADEYVTCEQCGVQLNDMRMYTVHFARVHPNKQRTQFSYQYQRRCLCEHCGKDFKNPTRLRYHMVEHSGLKPFQCEVCLKRFAHKNQLAVHSRVHNKRAHFACEVCGKLFSYQSNRNRHMWIHQEKYFKCEICEKKFSTASEMRSHVAHVHHKKPWPLRNRGSRTQGGRGRQGKKIKTAEDESESE